MKALLVCDIINDKELSKKLAEHGFFPAYPGAYMFDIDSCGDSYFIGTGSLIDIRTCDESTLDYFGWASGLTPDEGFSKMNCEEKRATIIAGVIKSRKKAVQKATISELKAMFAMLSENVAKIMPEGSSFEIHYLPYEYENLVVKVDNKRRAAV